MRKKLIELAEKDSLKDTVDPFEIGDTVDVHVRIQEGEKERIQLFTGTVIARKGTSVNESVTVRRMVQGEGVERVFPLHSPVVAKIVSKRKGKKNRAKLYYLRKRIGKKTKLTERRDDVVTHKKSTSPSKADSDGATGDAPKEETGGQ